MVLTISQVAARYGLSNRQVYDLISFGCLNIAQVTQENQGIVYWISEKELAQVDIYSLLAEVLEKSRRNPFQQRNRGIDWKRLSKTLNHYQRFLLDIQELAHPRLMENCFYLFHLNHYAKRYDQSKDDLYSLKRQVLKKMNVEYGDLFQITYLVGPDRKKVWLCDDCRDNARKAAIPYAEYARREYYCSKCYVQNLEKEYYSLLQFDLEMDRYRFSFHLPLSAVRWMGDMHHLNQGIRETGSYSDKMYLYGRPVSRVEEQVYPLTMILNGLNRYLGNEQDD